jgi:hypothetical protein
MTWAGWIFIGLLVFFLEEMFYGGSERIANWWLLRNTKIERISLTDPTERVKTHDFSRKTRTWGHDYSINKIIDGGLKLNVMGWGFNIKTGDYIILDNKDAKYNKTTRYKVTQIGYTTDPADMWFAELEFAPRPEKKND